MSETASAPTPAPPDASPPRGPKPVTLALFLLGLGALFLLNTWRRDLGDPGEGFLAHVAHHMASSGDWLVPRVNGSPHLELPPLASWLPAALERSVAGVDVRLLYRIPAALASLLSLTLTLLLGRRLFDARIAFLAMMIQASTALFFVWASTLDDDLIFASFLQLAITSFALATRPEAGKLWWIPAWAALGLAALTKSAPLAFALTLPPVALFLFFDSGLTGLRRGLRRARLIPGLVLLALIAAPWFAAVGAQHSKELLEGHLLGGHLARLTGSPVDARPPYAYLVSLVWTFLPWSLFLPLGVLHGKDRTARPGERLAIFWLLVPLVLLSFISAKRPEYLLICVPPAALLMAASFFETRESFTIWEELLRQGVLRLVPWLLRLPLLATALGAAAYFSGRLGPFQDPRIQALLEDREAAGRVLLVAGAGSLLLAFVSAPRVRRLAAAGETSRSAFELACATLFLFAVATYLAPDANPFLSSRAAVEHLQARIPEGARLALYGELRPGVLHALGESRPVTLLDYPDPLAAEDPALQRLQEYLQAPGTACLITSRGELEALRSQFPSLLARVEVLAEERVGAGEESLVLAARQ